MKDDIDRPTAPNPLWTTSLKDTVVTSVAVVGERLFMAVQASSKTAQHSELLALDLQTGDEEWRHHFEYALISGIQPSFSPATKQNVAIVASRSSDLLHGRGDLLVFDLFGRAIWQSQADGKSYSAPAKHGLDVLALAGDSTLVVVCTEPERDSVKRIPLPVNTSLSAPAVQDDIAYIPCRGPELAAVDLDLEGSVRWQFRSEDGSHAWLDITPNLMADKLFTVSRAGIVYCLQSLTGELVWQADIGNGRALSPPVSAGGFVFVGTRRGLVALDVQNGQVSWSLETTRPVSAAPLIVNDTVYAACEDHNLYALDLETGRLDWQHEMPRRIEVEPALAGDTLIIIDQGGNIAALPLPETDTITSHQPDARPARLLGKRQRARTWAEAGEPLRAAQLWLESGELEKAAEAFAVGGSWLESAKVWRQLDRLGKRAEALEQHAVQVSELALDDNEKAAAWTQAARAYAEIGQSVVRARCERKAAQYSRQPILVLEIEPEPMRLNAWSKLDYVIHNEGFGSARHIFVNIVDDRFEGYGQHTQTLVTIRPDSSYHGWLDVLPKAQGAEVPMRLAIEYVDRLDNEHRLQLTFHLPVAGESEISTVPSLSDSEVFARLQAPDGSDLGLLRRKMVNHFNLDEIHDLIFDFGLRKDDFDSRLSGAVRQMITWVVRNGRFAELIEWCQARRPSVDW